MRFDNFIQSTLYCFSFSFLFIYPADFHKIPRHNAAKDAVITLKRSEIADKGADAFTIRMTCRLPVTAPIEEGTELGTLEMLFDGRPVASVPVAAAETVVAGSFWRRVSDTIKLAFNKN